MEEGHLFSQSEGTHYYAAMHTQLFSTTAHTHTRKRGEGFYLLWIRERREKLWSNGANLFVEHAGGRRKEGTFSKNTCKKELRAKQNE
jgi:hypothetical protein